MTVWTVSCYSIVTPKGVNEGYEKMSDENTWRRREYYKVRRRRGRNEGDTRRIGGD